jgi:hypothetical protein
MSDRKKKFLISIKEKKIQNPTDETEVRTKKLQKPNLIKTFQFSHVPVCHKMKKCDNRLKKHCVCDSYTCKTEKKETRATI